MDAQLREFGKRVHRINRRHEKLSHGFVTVVEKDGLVVTKPSRLASTRFPWGLLALVAVGFFLFKGMLMAGLGEAQYAERASSLQAGSPVEQFGGWVMQPDPVTLWIGAKIGSIL